VARNAQQRKVVEFPSIHREGKKLFVLDTSVLLHDPEALLRFEEHDVFIPRQVVAQLDRRKKGQDDVARNARQVTRTLDAIFKGDKNLMRDGAPLAEVSNASATGKLFYQMETLTAPLPKDLLDDEADRRIIGVACALRRTKPRVILVSKDTNMRYAALGVINGNIEAQDYLNDRVLLKDSDILPTGFHELPQDFWDTHEPVKSWKQGSHDFWQVRGPLCRELLVNECVTLGESLSARVRECSDDEMLLESLVNYRAGKNAVWGIVARNKEQSYAFNHLMNPEIDLTMLLGDAGTGKSICALAAGFDHLRQGDAHEELGISQIIVTRALVPVGGEELGFLPGDVQDKFGPWMSALEDSKEALIQNARKREQWNEAQVGQYEKKVKIQPIGLIAGRTLSNCHVIVDEAQNLTPHQVRTLVTRAGDGTKFVFCGNLSQIDTPFLDEKSSGLASLVMKMRGHERVAHVILQECVRSRLAKLAVERL
jgi:PhoH-like ATPase